MVELKYMTSIQAIFLGIVEGLTEFLPISSTGHLTLASHFLGIVQSNEFIVFEIAIQLGAILAVFLVFWKKFLDIKMLQKLLIAFLPTGIIGLTVYKYIKTLLSNELIVAYSLLLGGIVLIIVEKIYRNNLKQERIDANIGFSQAFVLGLAQAIAIIPGVSRSGAVVVAGLLMKIERRILVEFTFLLAVPTMASATLYSLYKNKDVLSSDYMGNIALGFIAAFLVALLVIKLFLNYIKKYDFVPFGIYRIIIGTILLLTLIQIA